MFNGKFKIIHTNLPFLHLLFLFLLFALSSFASQMIYSNPFVLLMDVLVAVMQVTAVWVFS